jgi:tetratricopeptide (TPR) repeat protein
MKPTPLQKLENELRIAKGSGAIIFIVCEKYKIKEIKDKLINDLPEIRFEDINLSSESFETKYLPGILHEKNIKGINKNVVFNVFGFENAIPEIYGFIQIHRETIAGIKRPILLWVPEYIFKEIPLKASDFYRVRSNVYWFIEEKDERIKSMLKDSKETIKTEIFKFATNKKEIKDIKKTIKLDKFLLEDANNYTKISLYSSLADSYTKLKEFKKAENICKKARAIAEKKKDENWISIFSFKLGRIYYFTKNYKEAEKEYREAIRINPEHAKAHYNLGLLLANLKRNNEAEKEYREAIRINPEHTEAHNNLGVLLANLKRYNKAEKEFREAIRINPEHAEVHNNLGVLLDDLKRYDEAEKEYREAIQINPEHAEAHNNLGVLLANLKRHNESEKKLREAIQINSEYAEAHCNLGNLLYNSNRYNEAEKEYKEAIKINPELAKAHNNLGVLLANLKRYNEAEKEFRKVIRINPKHALAKNNLENLLHNLKIYNEVENESKSDTNKS